jgi:hypothetical protein
MRWGYEPDGFLPEPIVRQAGGCSLRVGDGVATATLPAGGKLTEELKERVRIRVEALLRAHAALKRVSVQLTHFTSFDGDGYKITPHGQELLVETGVAGDMVSFELRDERAEVVETSEMIRRRRSERFITAVEGALDARSQLVARLIEVNNSAQPGSYLRDVWEVIELLKAACGGDQRVARALGVDHHLVWKKFQLLANDEPLLEGRHRGSKPQLPLRPMTPDEREWAEDTIQILIERTARWELAGRPKQLLLTH